jgi:2,4-dienoyl-CoA reductase-like NADH-dependent reductase (Old Yellow Enzyme family)/thioredoxin reductase
MESRSFRNLLKPLTVNNLELPNRIVMPPMDCNYAGLNGEVTDRMVEHYEKRAKYGVGLIVIEATSVVSDCKNLFGQPLISENEHIRGFSNLVERIHAWGTKTLLQIMHPGCEACCGRLISPSGVASRLIGGKPISLTEEQIEELESCFINAAERAKIAGFDGVEIHGAHGYLINEFLSPFYNRRNDKYGGSLENRARFPIEIIKGIKTVLGRDFTISVRLSADEYIDGGLKSEESKELGELFQAAGADLLHVSAGIYDSEIFTIPPAGMPQALNAGLAKVIKESLNIPVIAVGKIFDPVVGEQLVSDGFADLVAFGRALLADEKFAIKISENRINEIRKCIGCRYCISRSPKGLDVKCAINPYLGREWLSPNNIVSRKSKRVLIIGGGPAGMQAAISARKIGHAVTLIEREHVLGGQLNLAVIPPYKDIACLLEYLVNEIGKLGVDLRLGIEADIQMIHQFCPDVIIIATGAKEVEPVDMSINWNNTMTSWQALLKPENVGEKVVIIGGGSTGCETAEFLADKQEELCFYGVKGQGPELKFGKKQRSATVSERHVTILEMREDVATDVEEYNRQLLILRLKESGVEILTRTKVREIRENAIYFLDGQEGQRKRLEANTFVLSLGRQSRTELFRKLSTNITSKLLAIGDCVKPGNLVKAIYQGALAAKEISE